MINYRGASLKSVSVSVSVPWNLSYTDDGELGAERARDARGSRAARRPATRVLAADDRRPQASPAGLPALDGRQRHGRLAGPLLPVAGQISSPGSRRLAGAARGGSARSR